VLGSNNYGRYSNMRAAFISAAGFALYTNRSFLYSLPMNCEPMAAWDELVDMEALAVPAYRADPPNLVACRRDEQQRGDLGEMTQEQHQKQQQQHPMLITPDHGVCSSRYGIPKPESEVGGTSSGARYLYPNHMEWEALLPDAPRWSPRSAAERIARSTCAGILCPWATFEVDAELKERIDAVKRSMVPAKPIQVEVERFLVKHGLADERMDTFSGGAGGNSNIEQHQHQQNQHAASVKPYVGVHLRLTDIAGANDQTPSSCRLNLTQVMEHVKALQSQTNAQRVLLATDDITSTCARTLLETFDALNVESGVWVPNACQEAVFVQEVLARSAGFIGHGGSTFSIAVEEIRRLRYNVEVLGIYVRNAE
jgi:hypothetical protein